MDKRVKTILSPKYVYICRRCYKNIVEPVLCRYMSTNPWKNENVQKVDVKVGERFVTIESGKLARFADGCAIAKLGETSVMVTAVGSAKVNNLGFLPLTVDYRQKAAAAGRIPTNYLRRELGPSDREILTGRMIDRSVRPLFPKAYNFDTQLVCNLLAVDSVHDPDVLSINAASAALALSDIPWNGPVGAVRIGYRDGEVVVNPTRNELTQSQLNLIVTGSIKNKIVMLEASAEVLPKEAFISGVKRGLQESLTIAQQIEELRVKCGKEKRPVPVKPTCDDEVLEAIAWLAKLRIKEVYTDVSHHKISRDVAIRKIMDDVLSKLKEDYSDKDPSLMYGAIADYNREIFRELIMERNLRCDGRTFQELRPLSCEVDLYKPLHGSALFQRGQTQVFSTLTFDSPDSAAKVDMITSLTTGMKEKNFFLHYEFPPYATNETGRTGIGRRELGHGALAERSLRPVVPNDFPFTIRLTAEVLESNGSSSMASVCAGSLALMDGGVPINEPVAGIAIGLVTKQDKEGNITDHRMLTDILGIEDYMGDMDFKMAGTPSGITSLQADIKLDGLPVELVENAMEEAIVGQRKILEVMEATLKEPRSSRKDNAPIMENIEVPSHMRGKLVGLGGVNLKKFTVETGVSLIPVADNTFTMFAPNQTAMDEAREKIDKLTKEEKIPDLEFGAVYNAKIVEIRDYGVMVQIHSSMQPVLVHNSQLDNRKIGHPSALNLEVDQEIPVKYFGRDPATGFPRLSHKIIFSPAPSIIKS